MSTERDWLIVGKIKSPVYEYRGYMREHMPLALRMRSEGKSLTEVATYLFDVCNVRSPYEDWRCMTRENSIGSILAGIRSVEKKMGLDYPPVALDRTYEKARREHAFLMRCEGETLKQIGNRLGVGYKRVGTLIDTHTRHMRYAMRDTKFRWA